MCNVIGVSISPELVILPQCDCKTSKARSISFLHPSWASTKSEDFLLFWLWICFYKATSVWVYTICEQIVARIVITISPKSYILRITLQHVSRQGKQFSWCRWSTHVNQRKHVTCVKIDCTTPLVWCFSFYLYIDTTTTVVGNRIIFPNLMHTIYTSKHAWKSPSWLSVICLIMSASVGVMQIVTIKTCTDPPCTISCNSQSLYSQQFYNTRVAKGLVPSVKILIAIEHKLQSKISHWHSSSFWIAGKVTFRQLLDTIGTHTLEDCQSQLHLQMMPSSQCQSSSLLRGQYLWR